MIYQVDVREILKKGVTVEANSIEDAKHKVKEMYNNEEIILDYEDFSGDTDVRVSDKDYNPLEDWNDNYIQ